MSWLLLCKATQPVHSMHHACAIILQLWVLTAQHRPTLGLISSPVTLQSAMRFSCRDAKSGMPYTQLSLQIDETV